LSFALAFGLLYLRGYTPDLDAHRYVWFTSVETISHPKVNVPCFYRAMQESVRRSLGDNLSPFLLWGVVVGVVGLYGG